MESGVVVDAQGVQASSGNNGHGVSGGSEKVTEEKGASGGGSATFTTANEAQPVKTQTVIRLKRRIEDSPSKILVVSYKRLKTEFAVSVDATDSPSTSGSTDKKDVSSSEDVKQILRLVGTVPEEEADNNNISLTVRNIIGSNAGSSSKGSEDKCNFRRSVKAKTSKVAEKARERLKKNAEESRFKIIASKRGMTGDQENGEEYDKDLLKLLDLVPEPDVKRKKEKPEGFEEGNVTCNGKPMVKEVSADEKGFVYDLYLTNDPSIEEFMCGQFLSVEEGDDELDFGEFGDAQEEDFIEEDEDSNAEDNWRNDYPDSEEEGLREESCSYGATGNGSYDDMHNHFNGLKLRDDSSSDDDLVYGMDDDNDGMGFDRAYLRYKRRVMQDEYSDEVVSSLSDSDLDGS